MTYRRRRRMRSFAKKQTFKHIVDVSSVGANFSTGTNSALIIEGIDNPSTTTGTDVGTGRHVMGMNFDLNIANTTGVLNSQVIDWYIFYNPADSIPFPDPTNVGGSGQRKFVLKQGMEMLQGGVVNHLTGYIKFPRVYQKFNKNDKIYIVWKSRINLGATDNFCFKAIFKETI